MTSDLTSTYNTYPIRKNVVDWRLTLLRHLSLESRGINGLCKQSPDPLLLGHGRVFNSTTNAGIPDLIVTVFDTSKNAPGIERVPRPF